jgi:predicted glutamine amidotransferase
MCLIIAAQKAQTIVDTVTDQEFLTAAKRNNDGVGVMYTDKQGEFCVDKYTPKTSTEHKYLVDFIKEHLGKANPDKAFAAHLRFTTHGENTDANTHPHVILSGEDNPLGKKIYMMHNGVIHDFGTFCDKTEGDCEDFSDTVRFANLSVKPILKQAPEIIKLPAFTKLLESTIGVGSKLVFMDETGEMYFANEGKGTWRKDVWFSTISYINTYTPPPPAKTQQSSFNNYQKPLSSQYTPPKSVPLKNPYVGKVKHCKDIQKAVETISGLLKPFDNNIKDKLRNGTWRLRSEPNLQNTLVIRDIEDYLDVLSVNGSLDKTIEELYIDCPADFAEILYYIAKTEADGLLEFEDSWLAAEHLKSELEKLKKLSFEETMQYVNDYIDEPIDLMYHILDNFWFSWQDEDELRRILNSNIAAKKNTPAVNVHKVG